MASVCDVPGISLLCQGASSVASSALDGVASSFAKAAQTVVTSVLDLLISQTTINLDEAWVRQNIAIMVTIALPVVTILFLVQVIVGTIRRQPGVVVRAVTGAGYALVGAAVSLVVVQLLLKVVDQLSAGVAEASGYSIRDAASVVAVPVGLDDLGAGAAATILFSLLFIVGALLIFATLLVRKALIIVAVVFAPLAFAGGTATMTSGWVRKWATAVFALAVSKLVIVVILILGVSAVGGVDHDGESISSLMVGALMLLIACIAPWSVYRFVSFMGTSAGEELHRGTSGAALSVVGQNRYTAAAMMGQVPPIVSGRRAAAGSAASGGAGAAGGAVAGGTVAAGDAAYRAAHSGERFHEATNGTAGGTPGTAGQQGPGTSGASPSPESGATSAGAPAGDAHGSQAPPPSAPTPPPGAPASPGTPPPTSPPPPAAPPRRPETGGS